MTGWIGVRGMRGLAGLLMITSLVVVQALQAAALRSCPHHSEAGHPTDRTVHAEPAIPHAAAPDSPSDGHGPSHGHGGPCDCLGPCGATALLQAPPTPAESVFAQVAPRRIPLADQVRHPVTLRILPFALPYPNAPPV